MLEFIRDHSIEQEKEILPVAAVFEFVAVSSLSRDYRKYSNNDALVVTGFFKHNDDMIIILKFALSVLFFSMVFIPISQLVKLTE